MCAGHAVPLGQRGAADVGRGVRVQRYAAVGCAFERARGRRVRAAQRHGQHWPEGLGLPCSSSTLLHLKGHVLLMGGTGSRGPAAVNNSGDTCLCLTYDHAV